MYVAAMSSKVPNETIIRQWYQATQNHRAVAERLELPLHYVMFVLNLMPESLFIQVNGGH
jgi:regulator of sirC expression with transglutaminase-like and TPR domain